MYLVVNKNRRIVASASYAINEDDCAKREETVIYIDNGFYVPEMIGCVYADEPPYYISAPSPHHTVIDGEYVLDAVGLQNYWNAVKTFRNRLLSLTDWTQLSDVKLTDGERDEWLKIREELRNVPEMVSTPEEAMRVLESYAIRIIG